MSFRPRLACAGKRKRVIEYVGEARLEPQKHLGRRIHRQTSRDVGERPDVIEPVHVVGVIVRKKERVDFANSRSQKLETQLCVSINEKARAVITFDARAYAGSLIPWIARSAHFAITCNLRNAEAGAGPEESQLQS